jgi:hypothetical protein
MKDREDIERLIKPENDLERLIIGNEDFIYSVNWGKRRNGHPEGSVINHIFEVLNNVDKFSNSINRKDLRLIAILHDSFKCKVDLSKPKSGENHHAMIARKFAESIGIEDKIILNIIELHDELHNAYLKGIRDNKWDKAINRVNNLIKKLDDIDITALDLYCLFFKCDTLTGDKSTEGLDWFDEIIYRYK